MRLNALENDVSEVQMCLNIHYIKYNSDSLFLPPCKLLELFEFAAGLLQQ